MFGVGSIIMLGGIILLIVEIYFAIKKFKK
jgi:hypothetical protein